MKKVLFSLLGTALLITSCSEKFKVAAPYKEVTVVYGYLDMQDTAHYVRVQKAFLDENKSAVDMAKAADSSFYSDINVRIDRYRASKINGVNPYVDSIHLWRVDLTTEGYPKEPGTFFNAPHYAYKFIDTLTPGYIYRLKVTHRSSGIIDSADAPIINRWLPSFSVPIIHNPLVNLGEMQFYSVRPKRYFEFNGNYIPSPGYEYNSETNPVRIAQALIRFNWHDSDINSKLHTPRFFDFNAGYVTVSHQNNGFEYKIENRDLYNAISTGMGAAPANVVRLIDRCEIIVYLSTTDFVNYLNATQLQGSGVTGSEITPSYTNVKGENVLGLYTSRAGTSGYITINKITVDSLKASPLLTHVNIKGTVYH